MAKELLTDIVIRSTKPIAAKDIRLSDGNGLYLLIKPNNSHWWRVDYSINQKDLWVGQLNFFSFTFPMSAMYYNLEIKYWLTP
jgi:hypothetical protein